MNVHVIAKIQILMIKKEKFMNDIQALDVPLTAGDVRNQVNLIQTVMKEVMQDGQHYGKIPGCGLKPTLLKPGAEKLSMVFRLRPIINNGADVRIDQMENNHREVTVYCHVMNMAGIELSTGVGSCSTMESKYRYRGGIKVFINKEVPSNYWDLDKSGKKDEAKELIGGQGFGVGKNPDTGKWEICEFGEKMENPDIADTYNTVLKMAKKRAYVDGILSATGASDIFTQDIEDMNPADLKNTGAPAAENKSSMQEPQAKKQDDSDDDFLYLDLITLMQGTKGARLNVVAVGISASHVKRPKKDKSGNVDISEYTVGDLPNNPTATCIIKVFGMPIKFEPNAKLKFNDVVIDEYNGKPQYIGKEAIAV